jgi:hypothetical protein
MTRPKNLTMNPETYRLRRQVIDLIYEAKALVPIPRVTVRITENDQRLLGQAKMKDNTIWITERAVTTRNIRTIVYHELLHAVFGVEHDADSPLMGPTYNPMDKESCQREYVRIIKEVD